jgi:hypothetical protein
VTPWLTVIDQPALARPPADRAEAPLTAAPLASGPIVPIPGGLGEIPGANVAVLEPVTASGAQALWSQPGRHSPGPVPPAFSAASSIGLRVRIALPWAGSVTRVRLWLRGRIRVQYAVTRFLSARCLLMGVRAACGVPGHLSAGTCPSG